MNYIESIISFIEGVFGTVLGIAYKICSFLGDKTMDLMLKLDSSCVSEFNKIFNTTSETVSILIGMLELSLLSSMVKCIIIYMEDYSFDNGYELNINSNRIYGGTGEIIDVDEFEEVEEIDEMIDELEPEQNSFVSFVNLGENSDFSNERFQQQMIDESNAQFMKESMDETRRAVTPADEGGHVHGAYLNPSDTFIYEESQPMFDEGIMNYDFDTLGSNDMLESFDSFDSFESDNDFDSFDSFDCNDNFDSFDDFGCDNSFDSFNDFSSGTSDF